MIRVNVTELRNHLPTYLGKIKSGEEVTITSRGKVIARLVPETDEATSARRRLQAISDASWVGDVISPIDDAWEAAHDNP